MLRRGGRKRIARLRGPRERREQLSRRMPGGYAAVLPSPATHAIVIRFEAGDTWLETVLNTTLGSTLYISSSIMIAAYYH